MSSIDENAAASPRSGKGGSGAQKPASRFDMQECARRHIGAWTNADELASAMSVLPKVEQDGSSECPFAEQLYARKEDAERSLRSSLRRLREYLPVIEAELSRAEKDLSNVRAETAKLRLDESKKQMAHALDVALSWRNRVRSELGKYQAMIGRIEASLANASTKKYSGKAPEEKPFRVPVPCDLPLPGAPVPYSALAPRPPTRPGVALPPPVRPPGPPLPGIPLLDSGRTGG